MTAVWWVILLIVFLVLEAVTMSLVTVWFALGAVGGLIAAAAGAGTWGQLVVFTAVSAVTLIFTRPALKKVLPKKTVPTNAELDLGRTAQVIESIDNLNGKGRIKLDGVDWSARSEDGSPIEEGASVEVTALGATMLTVRRKSL